ncbi:MAG TPA: GNAT family N-acetyltransferase [Candidatus Aquilonibacter sp.]|nr:GNAT family N-acetyltransferase [Candidatus Aquilonibacter sp.]
MMIDRALAVACELNERDGLRRCLTRAKDVFPQLGADVRELAGGIVGFSGVYGSLSEATAIGVEHDVTPSDIDAITEFFSEKGCSSRVTVSPVSAPNLGALLARAGYEPVEFQNTLVASLDDLDGAHDDRINEAADPEAWAEASARAFSDGADPTPAMLTLARLFSYCGPVALEARIEGRVAATGCYAFEDHGIAGFFAAGTLPEYRRRGLQRALIRERIARAKEMNMRFVRVSAEPLSKSERNFRALGFVPLYTRITWEQ